MRRLSWQMRQGCRTGWDGRRLVRNPRERAPRHGKPWGVGAAASAAALRIGLRRSWLCAESILFNSRAHSENATSRAV